MLSAKPDLEMSDESQQILDVAIGAAREAGNYLLSQRDVVLSPDEKQRNDFVTHADRHSESLITTCLRSHFPTHGIRAEEGSFTKSSSEYEWVIDPLDGTTNFIHRIPFFCVSIALLRRGKPYAGVVFNPVPDELFHAISGGGAFLNGNPVRVNPQATFPRALLATGFPHQRKRSLPAYLLAINDIFIEAAGIRRLGSAALDLCYTACGRLDGYWELGVNAWDIAAGALITREAGGIVSDFHGRENFLQSGRIIAAPAAVHTRLTQIMSIYFEEAPNE